MSQLKLVQTKTALNNVFTNFEIDGLENVDLNAYLDMTALLTEKQLKEEFEKSKLFKIETAVMVNLAKRSDNNIIYKNPYFRSGIKEINSSTNIPETFEIMKTRKD